jgi:hypothetical protein
MTTIPGDVSKVPDIEITASTPSKLTLAIDGKYVTFPGELVVTNGGGVDRILLVGTMACFDDGTPLDPQIHPLILSFLEARRFTYERSWSLS